MVSVVGLEPTRHKSTDSKSAMFANFITRTSKCWTSTSCATKILYALRFFAYKILYDTKTSQKDIIHSYHKSSMQGKKVDLNGEP